MAWGHNPNRPVFIGKMRNPGVSTILEWIKSYKIPGFGMINLHYIIYLVYIYVIVIFKSACD